VKVVASAGRFGLSSDWKRGAAYNLGLLKK